MQVKWKVLIASLAIVVLVPLMVLFCAIAFNSSILRNDLFPKKLRGLIELFVPPKDLYSRLVEEEIDISTKGAQKSFKFKNKYFRTHSVGLMSRGFNADWYFRWREDRITPLRLEVSFFVDGKKLLSKVVGEDCSPFIGRKNGGFSLMLYDCPEDLPIDQLITCEVRVIQPDEAMYQTYGPIECYIQKRSDH